MVKLYVYVANKNENNNTRKVNPIMKALWTKDPSPPP